MSGGSFEVTARSEAPVEAVWALLSDATTWSTWARFTRSGYEEEGEGTHGLGAVRSFGVGPARSRERVVAFAPPTHFAYELLSGLPVKGYRADVTLEPDGEATTILWASSWSSAWPGLGWFLHRTVKEIAASLARAAEDSR